MAYFCVCVLFYDYNELNKVGVWLQFRRAMLSIWNNLLKLRTIQKKKKIFINKLKIEPKSHHVFNIATKSVC